LKQFVENGKVEPIKNKFPAAVVAISGSVTKSEASNASPCECEGSDEDDSEDEKFVPSSIIQSFDAASESAEKMSAEGQDATPVMTKGDIETARLEPKKKPIETTHVGFVEMKRLVKANLRTYEEVNIERVTEKEATMVTKIPTNYLLALGACTTTSLMSFPGPGESSKKFRRCFSPIIFRS
jgi:hypothetical protein